MDEGPTFDRVLARYVTVWVWSILVGVNTSLAFSFINYSTRSRGLSVFILLGPVEALGVLSSLMAWYYIVKYMQTFIIPRFFGEDGTGKFGGDPKSYQMMFFIGRWMLLAIGFRLLLSIFEFTLNSLSYLP